MVAQGEDGELTFTPVSLEEFHRISTVKPELYDYQLKAMQEIGNRCGKSSMTLGPGERRYLDEPPKLTHSNTPPDGGCRGPQINRGKGKHRDRY